MQTEIIIGLAAGLGSAGACGFAFGAVIMVMGKRIDSLKPIIDTKVDSENCIIKHTNIMDRLEASDKHFSEIRKELSKAMRFLGRLDERTKLWSFDRRRIPWGPIPGERRYPFTEEESNYEED